ncbi:MAG: hypothetical protein PVG20_04275 [Thioalkalispiraceae bacterium]|jgi:hypothetical protein
MKTENIFKFVAVRPPEKKSPTDSLIVSNDNTEFQEQIDQKIESGVSPHQAMNEVATSFLNSDQYFSRVIQLQPLICAESRFRNFFSKKQLVVQNSKLATVLPETITGLYELIPDYNLAELIQSDESDNIKSQLFSSLYSHFILPEQNWYICDKIIFWIRAFHLFAAIRSENNESLYELLARFNQIYPAIPKAYNVYQSEPRMKHATSKPDGKQIDEPDSRAKRLNKIKAVKKKIQSLQSIESELNQLYQVKLEKEKSRPPQAVTREADGDTEQQLSFQKTATPWVITESDLSGNEKLLQLSKELGLTISNKSVFESSANIDELLAQEISELDDLQHIDEIKVVNGVFVKARSRVI